MISGRAGAVAGYLLAEWAKGKRVVYSPHIADDELSALDVDRVGRDGIDAVRVLLAPYGVDVTFNASRWELCATERGARAALATLADITLSLAAEIQRELNHLQAVPSRGLIDALRLAEVHGEEAGALAARDPVLTGADARTPMRLSAVIKTRQILTGRLGTSSEGPGGQSQ